MKKFTVTGMSCAACQAKVERAVSKLDGVSSCSVSLLTNSMGVEGTVSDSEIINAVEKAGYGASVKDPDFSQASSLSDEDLLSDKETPKLKKRLFASAAFLLILMYFSMGTMMFGFPLPDFLKDNCIGLGLVQLLLSGIVMVINQKFFISGFRSLIHLSPNMDTLIAMGSSASFIYSTVILFVMTSMVSSGNSDGAMKLMDEFYFESAAMILTLITVGKTLEAYSKGKTTNALKGLMKLAPKTAVVLKNGKETTVPIEDIKTGDIFIVRAGDSIPADGTVVKGSGAVDESALTGESIPVEKAEGSPVSSATISSSGYLECRATRVGKDTTLSEIIAMVSDAAATKAPVARLADRISLVFVPAVMILAVITMFIWLIFGAPVGTALARGICVLVVSCPCALGLATPVAIMVGNGLGAKNGILFKTAQALQETGKADIIVLDKTGTITKGSPEVTDVIPAEGVPETELIRAAASLEQKSEHPLASAICAYAEKSNISVLETESFETLSGSGVRGVFDGSELTGGSVAYISKNYPLPDHVLTKSAELASQGKSPMIFIKDGSFYGIIAAADAVKEDSAKAVSELRNMGLYVVMLTGDNKKTAEHIGAQIGADKVIAEVRPDEKGVIVRELKKSGRVIMVGDGINDAPALTNADVGIAIGAGTDIAIDAADVVLMKSRLSDAAGAVRLSKQTYKNIKENLFWALFYNVLLIPVAAGAYSSLNISMSPVFGAAAMSLSSVFVITNALRLNTFRLYNTKHDKKKKSSVRINDDLMTNRNKTDKEVTAMTKTMNIEGMMCGHCEASVKKALEALDGVSSADVSHKENRAVVTLSKEVSDEILKKAVEDKDYKVTGII